MDFRNFTTHAAERRRAGAILGTPPPVDGNEPACITATVKRLLRIIFKKGASSWRNKLPLKKQGFPLKKLSSWILLI